MNNNITQQNADLIKQKIGEVLRDNEIQVIGIIRQMNAIIRVLQPQIISVKKKRWWDIAFGEMLSSSRLDFRTIEIEHQTLKTGLNALQGLIDLLGALLTQRPQTGLTAYYRTNESKAYRIQASPAQYFQSQQASELPLAISLQGLKQLVTDGVLELEEDNRLLRTIERVQQEEAKANKGHGAEAYEEVRKHRRIGSRLLKQATSTILNRTSWNKKGDIGAQQVKYLGTEGNYFANKRKTASIVSVEEIVTYFTQQLLPLLKRKESGEDLLKQVDAIYQAFVDTENLQFYGQGFDTEAANEYIKTVQNELNKVGIRRVTINF